MALSADAYAAITLAIQTTGQTGVQALGASVQALDAQLQAYQAQLAAGAPVTQKAIDDLAALRRQLDQATDAYEAAQRVAAGRAADTARSTKGASQAMVELSRAFEDFATGGFLGALNNVPRTIEGIGQMAGLSAASLARLTAAGSALATVGFIVYENWDKIKALFDDGLGPKLIPDVKALKDELEALTGKQYKTTVDVRDIDILTGKINEAAKARRAYDALDAPSKAQKERADHFGEAVKEGGGRDALRNSVLAAEGVPGETPGVKAIRQQIAETVQEMSKQTDDILYQALAAKKTSLEESIKNQQSIDVQNRQAAVEDRIAKAALGDQKSIDYIGGLLNDKTKKFVDNGVDVDTFRGHLALTNKETAAKAKDDEKADKFYDERDRDDADRTSKNWVKAEHDAKVAADKAEREADAAKKKADAEAHAASERARVIAERKQARRVAEAKEVAPGYLPQAKEMYAANVEARMNGAPLIRTRKQLAQARALGQPYALSDVAMREEVSNQIAQGLRRSGQDPRLAPIIAGQAQEKAADTAARAFGATGNQFMAVAGVVGEAQGMLGKIQGQVAQQAGVVNHLRQGNQAIRNGLRRTQQQRPSLLTEGDNW